VLTSSFRHVLEIVATWKFPRRLLHCAQYAVAGGILRQRLLLWPWKRNLEAGLMRK